MKITNNGDRELGLQKYKNQGELNAVCHDIQHLGLNAWLRHRDSVQLFIAGKAGNLIAFAQLCFEPLHVDEDGVAVFKVVIDDNQPITGVRRTGEVMIVL